MARIYKNGVIELEADRGPGGGSVYGKGPSQEEKNWGVACHLAAFAGYFIPFGHLLGPFAIWWFKRQQFPFVDDQGREVLNFQLSITLYLAIAGLLTFIVIGVPLLVAISLFNFVMIIVGAVKARNGERYRYPLNLRFFK